MSSPTASRRRFRLPRLPKANGCPLLAGLVLLLFALRALLPVGFEPASDGSFSLVICQDDFPPLLHPSGAPQGAPKHGDLCTFCSSPSPAPAPLLLSLVSILLFVFCAVAFRTLSSVETIRLVHMPQARAPPPPKR